MRPVPTAGWSNLQPLALTNRGEVFGFGSPPHSGRTEVDFLWRRGRIIDLGALGGHRSDAAAVDRRGRVVGWFLTAAGDRHAFLWQDGRLRDLGTLGGRLSEARSVDESGRVVGTSTTRGGETHGFLWRSGRMTDLGRFVPHAVNGRGQMLGRSGRRLVLWTPG